ncbi:MAG: hypothetical protein ABS81_04575 [Pseudonocardia sp. SCN 72-86]|nr:MAG: hypothetical protein ABS81_04575 [Pseudonocardia sp. SCN 72-86]
MTSQAEALVIERDSPPTPSVGNPLIAGLPGFVVGSFALALQLLGFVSAESAGIVLPITFGASAVSTLVATVWASRVGDNAVAVIFVTFTGFWTSYSILVMALIHGWVGVPAAEAPRAQALFLLCWLLVIGALTVGTLRLPRAFTATLFLVDLALIFNVVGALTGSAWAGVAAGVSAVAFTLIGAYLLVGAVMECGGGEPFPVGTPLLRRA